MKHLDLFSGIGGFALAAQWVWADDHEIVAFCEIDKFCQKVLKKHWPDVPIISDIKELKANGEKIDLITGGFPCQDVSNLGSQAGTSGESTSLYKEMLRIIGEVRPKFVLMENVTALLIRGFGDVLRGLAEIGYNAEWHCIPATAVNAIHIRDRVWIFAYPDSLRLQRGRIAEAGEERAKQLSGLLQTKFRMDLSKEAICRRYDGIPREPHQLKALGNAIVPAVAQVIMEAIKEIANNENR